MVAAHFLNFIIIQLNKCHGLSGLILQSNSSNCLVLIQPRELGNYGNMESKLYAQH